MIPHFTFPFDFDTTNHAAVNEQDTIDDVIACVVLALITEPGQRVEVPSFGVPSQVFGLHPLDLGTLVNAVYEWENRVETLADQNPSLLDNLITQVQVSASGRSALL